MKNKGRKHIAGNGSFYGIGNCKGALVTLTRPINQMGSRNSKDGDSERSRFSLWEKGASKKFLKKKWSKRVRGYFKSQTSNLCITETNNN
jgi:hypothetical protein